MNDMIYRESFRDSLKKKGVYFPLVEAVLDAEPVAEEDTTALIREMEADIVRVCKSNEMLRLVIDRLHKENIELKERLEKKERANNEDN